MLLLGIDLETTGLDTTQCEIIEIGAVLWDTERQAPVVVQNDLIFWEDLELSEEIIQITGITKADLSFGVEIPIALDRLAELMKQADYAVAHNGTTFDYPILMRDFGEHDINFPMIPWIDTRLDVDFPTKTRRLVHLAAEHGFANPFAHRAFADVLTMLKILSMYDIEKVIDNSKQPLLEVQAVCAKPWEQNNVPEGQKDTDKAKARGYYWNPTRKIWSKNIRKSELEAEKAHGEFGIIVLEEIDR